MTEQEFSERFARAIKKWRRRLKMEQSEFAAFVGVSKNTIYNYESGRTMPYLYPAMLIAERLGISLDELVRGT